MQETLPDAVKNLSDEQRAGLKEIASRIHAGVAAKDLHDLMYAISEESGISSRRSTHPFSGRNRVREQDISWHRWTGSFCWTG